MLLCRTFSLHSPQMLTKEQNRALLLQFLLSDLLEAEKAYRAGCSKEQILSSHPSFIPYDWGMNAGFLNKMQEHSILLKSCFPKESRSIRTFDTALEKTIAALMPSEEITPEVFEKGIRSIYRCLEKFILLCRDNENLIFFLLKNKSAIDRIAKSGHLCTFLKGAYPEGLEMLGEKMCDQYHQRGFFSQIPEFKLLLLDLVHD